MKLRAYLLGGLFLASIPPALAIVPVPSAEALAESDRQIAAEYDRQIASCRSYAACMGILNTITPIGRAQAQKLATRLEQFGERAKRELLQRARVKDPPVSSVPEEAADGVLRYWRAWSEKDIPALRAILLSNRYSEAGWGLAEIATPAAARALVEGTALSTDRTTLDPVAPAGYAPYETSADPVARVGDLALPVILEQLSGAKWRNFSDLLSRVADKVVLPNYAWASVAADATKPISERVVALRALGSQHTMINSVRQKLDGLLLDSNPALQTEAVRAVRRTHATVPAEALARVCPLRENAFK